MFKIEDIIGDIVFISFRDYSKLADFGIASQSGHYLVKGYDHIGICLAHPSIILLVYSQLPSIVANAS